MWIEWHILTDTRIQFLILISYDKREKQSSKCPWVAKTLLYFIDGTRVSLAGIRLQQQTLPCSACPAHDVIFCFGVLGLQLSILPWLQAISWSHSPVSNKCTKIQWDDFKTGGVFKEAGRVLHAEGAKSSWIRVRVFRYPEEQKQAASGPVLAVSWQISPEISSLAKHHGLQLCFQAVHITMDPHCREKQAHLLLSPSKKAEMGEKRSWLWVHAGALVTAGAQGTFGSLLPPFMLRRLSTFPDKTQECSTLGAIWGAKLWTEACFQPTTSTSRVYTVAGHFQGHMDQQGAASRKKTSPSPGSFGWASDWRKLKATQRKSSILWESTEPLLWFTN